MPMRGEIYNGSNHGEEESSEHSGDSRDDGDQGRRLEAVNLSTLNFNIVVFSVATDFLLCQSY